MVGTVVDGTFQSQEDTPHGATAKGPSGQAVLLPPLVAFAAPARDVVVTQGRPCPRPAILGVAVGTSGTPVASEAARRRRPRPGPRLGVALPPSVEAKVGVVGVCRPVGRETMVPGRGAVFLLLADQVATAL